MKKLLFTLLLLPLLTVAYAQDDANGDKDVSIELMGGKTWDNTDFNISIKKKGDVVFVKYRLREEFDWKAMKNDTLYQTLKAKHDKLATGGADKKLLSEKLLNMMHGHRPTYQDSIIVKKITFERFPKLLSYIATANETAFNGGQYIIMDSDYILCKITYQGETRQISKRTPLSIDSPLLYVLLNETLKIGKEAGSKSAIKIGEVFKYLL